MSCPPYAQSSFLARRVWLAKAGLLLVGLVALAAPAQGQVVWNGTSMGANSNVWADNKNWSGTYPDGPTAMATFSGSGITNVSPIISGTITLQTLTFSSTQTYAISGGTLAFGANADTIDLTGTGGALLISSPVTLASTLTISDAAANTNTLNIAGGITGAGRNIVVSGSGTAPITLSGIIATGAGTLTMAATSATLTLSGTNTYTGGTTLTGGTIAVGNAAALGTGTLNLNGGTIEGVGAYTLTNAGILSASSTIGGSSALTFSGTLTNAGANTLTLSNTGGTSLGGLNLSTSVADTLTLNAASATTATISGIIANGGGGASGLTKTGAGTVVISGTSNNSFTGSVTINGGTLTLAKTGGALAIPAGSGGITINSGGTLLNSANNQIGQDVPMKLNGGTWNLQGHSEQTPNAGNTAFGVGALTLSATSTLSMGTPVGANSIVLFAASNVQAWSGTLDITNWTGLSGNPQAGGGPDQIYFGTTRSGLNAVNAGDINDIMFININPGHGYGLGNYNAQILADGEIVPVMPVPEPATPAAGAALGALLVLSAWRRRQAQRAVAMSLNCG